MQEKYTFPVSYHSFIDMRKYGHAFYGRGKEINETWK